MSEHTMVRNTLTLSHSALPPQSTTYKAPLTYHPPPHTFFRISSFAFLLALASLPLVFVRSVMKPTTRDDTKPQGRALKLHSKTRAEVSHVNMNPWTLDN